MALGQNARLERSLPRPRWRREYQQDEVVHRVAEVHDGSKERAAALPERVVSFDILHLLPHPFDFGLQLDDSVSNGGILRLCSDRIYLAGHLLQKEIEAPAVRPVGGEIREEMIGVDREAGELFGDVGTLEEDDELLLDPRGIEPAFGRF